MKLLSLIGCLLILSGCANRQQSVLLNETKKQNVNTIGEEVYSIKLETLSDKEILFKTNINLPNSPLVKDLVDLYNACAILNSIWCDFELWVRFNIPVKEDVMQIDYSSIYDNDIKRCIEEYKNKMLSVLPNDTILEADSICFDKAYEAYHILKEIIIDRYHVSHYGSLSEDEYWKNYNKGNYVSDYDSMHELYANETEPIEKLQQLANSEKDFNKKCVYLLEYARVCYTQDWDKKQEIIDSLEMILRSNEYSIYLYEVWRIWRILLQEGFSRDSEIDNGYYNQLRMVCVNTILNYIVNYPNDIMAINQFLMLSSIDNVYRYGEYPYGNQIAIEKLYLFPELYYSEKKESTKDSIE